MLLSMRRLGLACTFWRTDILLSADLLYILKRNARAQTSVRLLSEMSISGNLTVSWIMLGRGPSCETKALYA